MPQQNGVQIFTRQDLETLVEQERKLLDLLPEFDKAEECGENCQLLRELAQKELKRIQAIKSNFMNPAPT